MHTQFDASDPLTFDGLVTVSSLTPGKFYRLHSTALNALGESEASIEVIFAAASLAVKPASIMRHSSTNRDQLVIEWAVEADATIPVTGYRIEADLT